jgi:hypothetical protein
VCGCVRVYAHGGVCKNQVYMYIFIHTETHTLTQYIQYYTLLYIISVQWINLPGRRKYMCILKLNEMLLMSDAEISKLYSVPDEAG